MQFDTCFFRRQARSDLLRLCTGGSFSPFRARPGNAAVWTPDRLLAGVFELLARVGLGVPVGETGAPILIDAFNVGRWRSFGWLGHSLLNAAIARELPDPIFVEMDVIGPETDATAKSPGR
jgi:hypothetical protein